MLIFYNSLKLMLFLFFIKNLAVDSGLSLKAASYLLHASSNIAMQVLFVSSSISFSSLCSSNEWSVCVWNWEWMILSLHLHQKISFLKKSVPPQETHEKSVVFLSVCESLMKQTWMNLTDFCHFQLLPMWQQFF